MQIRNVEAQTWLSKKEINAQCAERGGGQRHTRAEAHRDQQHSQEMDHDHVAQLGMRTHQVRDERAREQRDQAPRAALQLARPPRAHEGAQHPGSLARSASVSRCDSGDERKLIKRESSPGTVYAILIFRILPRNNDTGVVSVPVDGSSATRRIVPQCPEPGAARGQMCPRRFRPCSVRISQLTGRLGALCRGLARATRVGPEA